MNPISFFEPLLGQSLLYPGQSEIYRGQCVQSVMMWIKANGTEPPVYPSAADYFTKGIPGYTKILSGQPIKTGDIVVWGKNFPPSGGNGHIDVASANGSLGSFPAYDSNWNPLILSHILHSGNNNNYIAGYLRRNMATDSLTKEEIISIYTGFFDLPDDQTNGDLINAYTGKPLDGLLQQLHSDPSYQAHYQKVNNPPAAGFKPAPELFIKE